MTNLKFVFAIDSITADPVEVDNRDRDEAKKSWLCTGCSQPKEGFEIPPIKIKGKIKDLALNFIYGIGLGVIRDDFLKLIRHHNADSEIYLVALLNSEGVEIQGVKAFRVKKNILIRGNSHSSWRKCDECGRQLCHPLGSRYVLRSSLANVRLLGDQFNGFIVPLEIATHVKKMAWKEIAISKLPISELDTPTIAPEVPKNFKR